jgi:hypothetical protein
MVWLWSALEPVLERPESEVPVPLAWVCEAWETVPEYEVVVATWLLDAPPEASEITCV